MKCDRTWTITGQRLAELLRTTCALFLHTLQLHQLSRDYVSGARLLIVEFAGFCYEQEAASPWRLRQKYLAQRGVLRAQQRYSSSYLEANGRELVNNSIQPILRTNLVLCRKLAAAGHNSFARLRVSHLDDVVSSLLCAPPDDLLRRRQQVQQHNSKLRGFLRYLYQRGLLDRDLAPALISPPCWRASKPPTVLSEKQVQGLLDSVDRRETWGRRCYAMLLLLTTYGLRPIDVAQLRLDALHWPEQSINLVQKKTGRSVTLPLLPEVSAALYDYLRHDRVPGLRHRQVFVSISWPHRPVLGRTVADVAAKALREAGLSWARTKHLRASVATHLLRQGESLSTIQEVLGHRAVETTQRYAVTDVEMLRQVIEESQR